MKRIINPPALKKGDIIGIFTPSHPSYQDNEEMFRLGVKNIEAQGFKVKLGSLTKKMGSQGYRSGTPKDRGKEFMELIIDPTVKGMISTIGGNNSASMIPYLDFRVIKKNPKVICGYSDVTSLHLAILYYSGLSTFYGTAAMPWFGEFPNGESETLENFLMATMEHTKGKRIITPPKKWSNHFRNWADGSWKKIPREWKDNQGWKVLNKGKAQGPIICANLSTFCSNAGTPHFPNLKNKILLIESMSASMASEERNLRHLQLLGVFDKIKGLIIGKPEKFDAQSAPFSHEDLIMEIVGKRDYPVISGFDLGHTVPMITMAQMSHIKFNAVKFFLEKIEVMGPMVSDNQ